MQPKKREPILADRLMTSMDSRSYTMMSKDWYHERLDNIAVAKKFVLDSQAATWLGEMIRNNPEVIADAQEFAISPFALMWVEIPFAPFYRAVNGVEPDETGDKAVGYLFEGPVVTVASYGWEQDRFTAGFNPVQYILHLPMGEAQEAKLSRDFGIPRFAIDSWLWGETVLDWSHLAQQADGTDEAELAKERIRSLRENHFARMAPVSAGVQEAFEQQIDKGEPIGDFTQGAAGDLRNAIALLLYLNRTHDIQVQREVKVGPTQMVGRRPRALFPHRVISLKLDPKETLLDLVQTISGASSLTRRLHDVRGHFCHNKASKRGCTHGLQYEGDLGELWVEYAPMKWRCDRCGGLRWWRREHSRGSAEEGAVAQQYAVTR